MGRFELRNRSRAPHFNGLVIVSTMKETNSRYFLLPANKEVTKQRIWKDMHCLISNFTWFNLNEIFNAC